jgi:Haem-binding domain/Cytochrome P460
MRMSRKLVVGGAATILLLQLVRPPIESGPATAEIQAPPQVRRILDKDCYSCHSNERRLEWFDEVVPAYWLVRHDIFSARRHVNLSTLGSKPVAAQRAALFEAVNMIQLGAMPLPKFVALHPGSNVTPEELATLKSFLAPWNPRGGAVTEPNSLHAEEPPRANLQAVAKEFNGVEFQRDFEDWKPISFTDRGDNNTLRVILGNDIAVKAVESGGILPWPNGTRLAKVAWEQATGEDGLIHPGRFVQVELMVKETRVYAQSEGWGWGRWRGAELKPYGMNSGFVTECTGCHAPMRGDDFVYTLPITRAKSSQNESLNNKAAVWPQNLPYQPLGWSVITLYVDPGSHTMAALYANDIAMHAARARSTDSSVSTVLPSGSVFALVTWIQREDPHWFGGRIPDAPKSVEFVEASTSGKPIGYRCYDGSALGKHGLPADVESKRIKLILTLSPAWLP